MENTYGLIQNDRQQRMTVNGQCSNWSKIKAGVLQGSTLGLLFFIVYINDLPEILTTNAELVADDMSLLSVVHDSAVSLNNELQKNVLTNFSPMSHFYTPWKRQKTYGFLTFSGGIEMWHWTKMG